MAPKIPSPSHNPSNHLPLSPLYESDVSIIPHDFKVHYFLRRGGESRSRCDGVVRQGNMRRIVL